MDRGQLRSAHCLDSPGRAVNPQKFDEEVRGHVRWYRKKTANHSMARISYKSLGFSLLLSYFFFLYLDLLSVASRY